MGHCLGFGTKAIQLLRAGMHARQDHLQRDIPLQSAVLRVVDDPHSALAQLA